jgi:hypothetical protein
MSPCIRSIALAAALVTLGACGEQSMQGAEVELPAALGEKILADNKRLRTCLRQFGLKDDLVPFVRVKAVDLNGDDNPEFVITNRAHHNCLCGNRSCAGWVYRNAGKQYEALLLKDSSDRLRRASTVTNGYSDLIEESDGLRVFLSFNSRGYERALCEEKGTFDIRWKKITCPAPSYAKPDGQ